MLIMFLILFTIFKPDQILLTSEYSKTSLREILYIDSTPNRAGKLVCAKQKECLTGFYCRCYSIGVP